MNCRVCEYASGPPMPTAMWKTLMPESRKGCKSAAVNTSGSSHPAPELGEVERQRAEHVDHCRPLHEVDGPRGVLLLARGKESVPPAAHEWSTEGGDAETGERGQDLAAIQHDAPHRDTLTSVKTPVG